MGYLDNSTITVDAILTKKGRELLAKGRSQFKITQFALADDEVDYDLWNPAHPLGSDYYGVVIENMPITEAVPDETQSMKYKLITLPKGTTAIPYITVQNSNISFSSAEISGVKIEPKTLYNGENLNQDTLNSYLGYTATLLDTTFMSIMVDTPAEGAISPAPVITTGDSETANSISVIGKSFIVKPAANSNLIREAKSTKIILTGNETGGRVVLNVTVRPKEQTL